VVLVRPSSGQGRFADSLILRFFLLLHCSWNRLVNFKTPTVLNPLAVPTQTDYLLSASKLSLSAWLVWATWNQAGYSCSQSSWLLVFCFAWCFSWVLLLKFISRPVQSVWWLLAWICLRPIWHLLTGFIRQIIMFSDLECDYINPIDLCNKLNQVSRLHNIVPKTNTDPSFQFVLPENIAHAFLALLFLLSGQWFAFILNLPLVLFNANKYELHLPRCISVAHCSS